MKSKINFKTVYGFITFNLYYKGNLDFEFEIYNRMLYFKFYKKLEKV